jgi:hypothetical protein
MFLAAVLAGCGGGGDSDKPSPDAPTQAAEATVADPTAAPPTAEPTSSIPAGWRSFEQDTFALALPPAYTGGDPSDNQTIGAMQALGGDCAASASALAGQAAMFVFAALDNRTCYGNSVRTIGVIAGPFPGDAPADFIAEFVPGLPATATLLGSREGTVGGAPAAIIQVQRSAGALTTVQDIYALRGSRGWVMLSLATATGDYEAARPEFDAIAQTLRAK